MTRMAISKATRDSVMAEFRSRCAICGEDRPQIHHIDMNNENNDPNNLIPLCPNCHLTDQHDPTATADRGILALFRMYKDPVMLGPQFKPLFKRMRYLKDYLEMSAQQIANAQSDLIEFVKTLKMGEYYAKKIKDHINLSFASLVSLEETADEARRREENRKEYYIKSMESGADRVAELLVELVRYQGEWKLPSKAMQRDVVPRHYSNV